MENKQNGNNNVNRNALTNGFFEIHVRGHLDNSWSDWLGDLEVTLLENGEMILFGHIGDQAALMGTLNKLNGLNLALLSLKKSEPKK